MEKKQGNTSAILLSQTDLSLAEQKMKIYPNKQKSPKGNPWYFPFGTASLIQELCSEPEAKRMEENSRVSPFIFIWQKEEAGHRKAILANLDWINFEIFLRVREILVQSRIFSPDPTTEISFHSWAQLWRVWYWKFLAIIPHGIIYGYIEHVLSL